MRRERRRERSRRPLPWISFFEKRGEKRGRKEGGDE